MNASLNWAAIFLILQNCYSALEMFPVVGYSNPLISFTLPNNYVAFQETISPPFGECVHNMKDVMNLAQSTWSHFLSDWFRSICTIRWTGAEDFVGTGFCPSMQTHSLFSVFVVCKVTQRSFLITFVLFFLLRALNILNSCSNMNSACLWKLMLSFPRGWLWPCSLPNQFYSSIMEAINEQVRAEHLSPVCRCEAQLWGR